MCMQTRSSERTPLLTALLEGPAGAGKTAIAATLGIDSGFPYVKVVSADNMVGWAETAKASQIAKVFDDAYKVRHAAGRALTQRSPEGAHGSHALARSVPASQITHIRQSWHERRNLYGRIPPIVT